MKVTKVVHHINVPRMVCNHLVGEDHSHKHRMTVGAIIMMCGVYIAKSAGHCEIALVEMGADLFGYLVHGIGAIPYVDALVMVTNLKKDND